MERGRRRTRSKTDGEGRFVNHSWPLLTMRSMVMSKGMGSELWPVRSLMGPLLQLL